MNNVKLPFGVKYFTSHDGDVKASAVLSLDGSQDGFINQIVEIEKFVQKEACNRSKHWFGHQYSESEINDMFRKSLYHQNKKYS